MRNEGYYWVLACVYGSPEWVVMRWSCGQFHISLTERSVVLRKDELIEVDENQILRGEQ
jgi:hypothetical protein